MRAPGESLFFLYTITLVSPCQSQKQRCELRVMRNGFTHSSLAGEKGWVARKMSTPTRTRTHTHRMTLTRTRIHSQYIHTHLYREQNADAGAANMRQSHPLLYVCPPPAAVRANPVARLGWVAWAFQGCVCACV